MSPLHRCLLADDPGRVLPPLMQTAPKLAPHFHVQPHPQQLSCKEQVHAHVRAPQAHACREVRTHHVVYQPVPQCVLMLCCGGSCTPGMAVISHTTARARCVLVLCCSGFCTPGMAVACHTALANAGAGKAAGKGGALCMPWCACVCASVRVCACVCVFTPMLLRLS